MRIPASIKIIATILLSFELFYLNYLVLESDNMGAIIDDSWLIQISSIPYLFIIYVFAVLHWKRKAYFTFGIWLFFNGTIIVNGLFYYLGEFPPLLTQYSFSGSLFVYGTLLLISRIDQMNWFRIFALANLILLIPCIFFYFQENWGIYRLFVYILSFTPIFKSFIFLNDRIIENDEILDEAFHTD